MANKLLRCTGCKENFPRESMHKMPKGSFHTIDCALKYVRRQEDAARKRSAAKSRREYREVTTSLKKAYSKTDVRHNLKLTQAVFNTFIRLRDKNEPCISCDQSPNHGQRHASHYRSVGACSVLRFNEDNVSASCAQCNSMKSGNITEYRIRLVKKIGATKVDWLECQNEPRRYSCQELIELRAHYAKLNREMENEA